MQRDLALKVLAFVKGVRQALADLMDTMFIIYQPKYFTGSIGDMATYTVVAMNVDTYQWEVSSDGGTTWTNSTLSTANTPEISIKVSNSNKTRLWRCALTDENGNTIYSDIVGIIIG